MDEGLRLALGILTGFELLRPGIPLGTIVATMIPVHICDAIVCRLVASHGGRPKNSWTVAGGIFGVWAMAMLILLPKKSAEEPA